MDRCALFVDAGYLLADGALAVHGTRRREAVSWDFGGLLQLLGNLARERTGLPLLRCYWYEATLEGRRAPEHEALADLPGLKLRLGRVRPGRREGVDTEIHRDLMTLARNGALADAIVVSNDEDLAQVIADAQDLGVRVTVLHVGVEGNWTISRALRQECDDLIEIGSAHLRPYVNLLTGVDSSASAAASSSSLSNGHAASTVGSIPPLQTGAHAGPPQSSSHSPSPASQTVQPQMGQAGQIGHMTPIGHSGHTEHSPIYAAPTPAPAAPAAPAMPMPPTHVHGSGSTYTSSASPTSPMSSGSPTSHVSPASSVSATPPTVPPQHGPYTGPQQLSSAPGQQATSTLSDAVKAAHQEGQDFGESVARDAPALWLEAVLARKPRMPSDLEARLLQGSSLPIDFLLHDEVRHALRRGFWDALERSRR